MKKLSSVGSQEPELEAPTTDYWERHCSKGDVSCDFGWCCNKIRKYQDYYVRVSTCGNSEVFCSDCAAVALFQEASYKDYYFEGASILKEGDRK